jgi:hypothetical protein
MSLMRTAFLTSVFVISMLIACFERALFSWLPDAIPAVGKFGLVFLAVFFVSVAALATLRRHLPQNG